MTHLKELSDADYQQRVWAKRSDSEASSLNEATAALYDDSGLGEALEKNDVTFSPEIDRRLSDLRVVLRGFLQEQSTKELQEILDSANWSLVREKAMALWEALSVRK